MKKANDAKGFLVLAGARFELATFGL